MPCFNVTFRSGGGVVMVVDGINRKGKEKPNPSFVLLYRKALIFPPQPPQMPPSGQAARAQPAPARVDMREGKGGYFHLLNAAHHIGKEAD